MGQHLNHQIWVSLEKVMIEILKSVQSEPELNSDFPSFNLGQIEVHL